MKCILTAPAHCVHKKNYCRSKSECVYQIKPSDYFDLQDVKIDQKPNLDMEFKLKAIFFWKSKNDNNNG